MKPSRRNVFRRLSTFSIALSLAMLSTTRGDDQPNSEKEKAAKDQASTAESQLPKKHEVKAGRLKITVDFSGTFESKEMAPVTVKPEAWTTLVVKKAVAHGAQVKKGEPVIWLETDKLDEAIRTAEHAVKTATLALQQGEADLRLAEGTLTLDLKTAELAKQVADEKLLDYVKVDRQRRIASAERSLDSSRFALESVQEELNQLKKMYEADDLTEETEEFILKRAERSVDSSKYALESAEIRTARLLERDVPRTEQQLVDEAKRQEYQLQRAKIALPAGLETKRLTLEKLRLDHQAAEKKLAKLKKDRQLMTIKSPADGVVYYGRCVRGKWLDKTKTDGMLKPGGTLLAKQTVLTIVSRRPLQVRVDLPEAKLSKVKQGLSATAVPVGFDEMKLGVKVEDVSYIPLAAGLFDCTLSVADDADIGPVMPGMTCKIELVSYDKKQALTVPPAAVHQDEDRADKSFVYLVADGEPLRRDVVVGRRGDKSVEILQGLKAGDTVLVGKPK